MNRITRFLFILMSIFFITQVSFAATAMCQVTNNKTGQTYSADGGGPTQLIANQKAQDKALGKCHAESAGWPGQCFVVQCNPS